MQIYAPEHTSNAKVSLHSIIYIVLHTYAYTFILAARSFFSGRPISGLLNREDFQLAVGNFKKLPSHKLKTFFGWGDD